MNNKNDKQKTSFFGRLAKAGRLPMIASFILFGSSSFVGKSSEKSKNDADKSLVPTSSLVTHKPGKKHNKTTKLLNITILVVIIQLELAYTP